MILATVRAARVDPKVAEKGGGLRRGDGRRGAVEREGAS